MIAISTSTYRTASRLVRLGVGFFRFAIVAMCGAICAGAYFCYFVIPGIVAEAEYRENRFAIRSAQLCGKHKDLVRQSDGVWRCERHNYLEQ